MAQYYSLDEAARVLGISPDELKQKAQSREIRAFMGSGTWQFRTADIDEFARQMGHGSNPDFSLSDMELPGPDSDLLNLSAFEMNPNNPDLAPPTLEHAAVAGLSKTSEPSLKPPLAARDDDDDVVLFDDMSAGDAASSPSSSRIIGLDSGGSHRPSDSDVRIVPESASSSSDSDVKASPAAAKGKSDLDSSFDSSMEIGALSQASQPAIPAMPAPNLSKPKPPTSGDTVFAKSPVLDDSSDEIATPEGDSDFDYTPSSVLEAFPDSGSDFELPAMDDVSDEFVATPVRSPSDSDVTAGGMSAAGITSKPSDSGINLGALSGFAASPSSSDSMDSLELQPLEGASTPARPSLGKSGKPQQQAVFGTDTDFELDVKSLSGDGEATMQLPADSDFDLSDSDGSSEIISLEDDVDANAATAMRAAVLEDEGDSDFSGGGDAEAFASSFEEDTVSKSSVSSVAAPAAVGVGAAVSAGPSLRSAPQQVEWGGLWVGMLSISVILTGLLSFVAFDLVRNLYAWNGEGPASGLIKSLAGMFGG